MALVYYNKKIDGTCIVHKYATCATYGFMEFEVSTNIHAEEAKRKLVENKTCSKATKCDKCF